MTIASRITEIRQQLPPQVHLIAVTKQVSIEKMRQAYDRGIRDFGESKIQEALPKQQALEDLKDIRWHFIGHLQGNKARKVLETFSWIHSIDSLKLALRLNQLATELGVIPQVFLQVKVLPDADKFGWEIDELLADLTELEACQQLKIQGLMTILPLGISDGERLAAFEKTRELARIIEARSSLSLPHFSMGMSSDYLLAVSAGATFIRLGTIIFGERN